MNTEPLQVLLQNDATVFPYDFGKKEVKESWTVRRNNAIKSVSEIKTYTNYHLITGDANIVDVDLDCTEARLLASLVIDLSSSIIKSVLFRFQVSNDPVASETFHVIVKLVLPKLVIV